ncbi:uncharacterized protein LOC121872307 isoform X2 [Homarus americanus]|nr:uncharacterized protein LOC121872307 isoform X2 [Homarus americanus]
MLQCQWSMPYNPAQTRDYQPYLVISLSSSISSTSLKECPRSEVKNSCTWNISLQYDPTNPNVTMMFRAANPLHPQREDFWYHTNLLAVVLPDPVSNLTLEAAETGRVLRAEWSTPQPLIQFPANLTYRVDYRLADSTCSACSWTTGDVGECNSERCEATVEVEYWGQQYLVCVRLRSGAATYTLDDDIWWSKCSNMNTDTPPSVPDSSPVVGPGTFQVSNNIPELRDLTLAWQLVPPLLHNGPNFSYVVSAIKDDSGELVAESVTVTDSFASFPNLSTSDTYRLQVVAENSEGRSSVTSVVKVEATSDLPDPPVLPVVVYHQQQHLYELRWSNESELGNRYTVYVCMDDLKNSAPCHADLRWINVGQVMAVNVTMENFNLTDGRGVRFAVSAESDSGASSGMTWDKCGTPRPYNTNLQPPTDPKSEDVRQTTAWVSWKLDCENWAGVVESVVAKCCTGHHNLPQDCTGEEKEVEQEESEVWRQRVEVTGLKESTQYTVWLRLKYRSGISQWSLAQTFTTDSSGLPGWTMVVIMFGAILSVVVIVVIVTYTRRKMNFTMKEMTRDINLPEGLVSVEPPAATTGDHTTLTTGSSTHTFRYHHHHQRLEVIVEGLILKSTSDHPDSSPRQDLHQIKEDSQQAGGIVNQAFEDDLVDDSESSLPAVSASGNYVSLDMTKLGVVEPQYVDLDDVKNHGGYVQWLVAAVMSGENDPTEDIGSPHKDKTPMRNTGYIVMDDPRCRLPMTHTTPHDDTISDGDKTVVATPQILPEHSPCSGDGSTNYLPTHEPSPTETLSVGYSRARDV